MCGKMVKGIPARRPTGSSKAVAVGQQDHGGVAMPVATVLASGLDELLDRPRFAIRLSPKAIVPP
jgi:hypothetical protein